MPLINEITMLEFETHCSIVRTMKNLDLTSILSFVTVAKAGSFTQAAHTLGVPKSFVSRKVTELESRLKVRLIDRTTRKVFLTELGLQYFATCEKSLGEILETEKSFEVKNTTPSGRLRITCPVEFGAMIVKDLCQKFLIKYPEIQIEIISTNNILNLIEDKIDVAIRPMQFADPSMMSIQLGQLEWALYASPAWVHSNYQSLEKIDSLSNLDILAFHPAGNPKSKFRLSLNRKDKEKVIEYFPRIITSNLTTLLEACMSGSGIAAMPHAIVQPHVTAGRLVRVFPDWHTRKETVVAVYSAQKNIPLRVRVLLDFLKTQKII